MPVYFGELTILGQENIPADKPIIIAPNHQNAFLDAVLIGATLPRNMHFLTRSDVFKKPFVPFLRALHMLPVYRMRDGIDNLSKNDVTFETCIELLRQNEAVLIFPEANMSDTYHLRRLSKGTARLGCQAQEKSDDDIYIIPTGINYFHHTVPRNRVVVKYGKPIRLRDYAAQLAMHHNRALLDITQDISEEIRNCLLLHAEELRTEHNLAQIRSAQYSLDWTSLKAIINSQDSLPPPIKPNTLVSYLLSVPNMPVYYLEKWLLRRVKGTQFYASVKYIFTILAYPAYWLILILILGIFISWYMVIGLLTMVMCAAFGRAVYYRRLSVWDENPVYCP